MNTDNKRVRKWIKWLVDMGVTPNYFTVGFVTPDEADYARERLGIKLPKRSKKEQLAYKKELMKLLKVKEVKE